MLSCNCDCVSRYYDTVSSTGLSCVKYALAYQEGPAGTDDFIATEHKVQIQRSQRYHHNPSRTQAQNNLLDQPLQKVQVVSVGGDL